MTDASSATQRTVCFVAVDDIEAFGLILQRTFIFDGAEQYGSHDIIRQARGQPAQSRRQSASSKPQKMQRANLGLRERDLASEGVGAVGRGPGAAGSSEMAGWAAALAPLDLMNGGV